MKEISTPGLNALADYIAAYADPQEWASWLQWPSIWPSVSDKDQHEAALNEFLMLKGIGRESSAAVLAGYDMLLELIFNFVPPAAVAIHPALALSILRGAELLRERVQSANL